MQGGFLKSTPLFQSPHKFGRLKFGHFFLYGFEYMAVVINLKSFQKFVNLTTPVNIRRRKYISSKVVKGDHTFCSFI